MPIARDEVAHLARLSRLALRDDELDHLAPQLDQIIAAVAQVQEVAAEGIPPTSHATGLTNVFRDDVPVAVPHARPSARPGARGGAAAVPGAADPGGGLTMDLTRMTAAELSAAMAAGEVSAAEVTEAHLARIAAVDDRVHAFLHVAADSALARPREIDDRRRRASRSARWPASRWRSRTCSPPSACRPPAAPASWTAGTRRTTPPSPGGCGRPARSSSARPTWTSSPWAPPPRTRRSGPAATRGTWAGSRAARPAARPPRWPRTRRRWASAPTPAARSASPPRSAGSSASSPPTAARPGTGWWPSPPRWTRRARWPGPCSTPRCCTRRSPGTTRATPPRSTRRCRRWSPRPGRPT